MLLLILICSFGAKAQFDNGASFQKCSEGDLMLLEAATFQSPGAIKRLVDEEILENNVDCMVKKPRFFHPAVCGAAIVQLDTYMIKTSNRASYTVVVDSSYKSCLRIRVAPAIKSLKYEPSEEVVLFP